MSTSAVFATPASGVIRTPSILLFEFRRRPPGSVVSGVYGEEGVGIGVSF